MPSELRSPSARAAALLAGLAIVSAPAARGGWSADPAHPLVLADAGDEQVQPKIVARDDGGFYVSWFDNSSGGYDVRLQRLDSLGNELWAHGGVLVADRGLSSTTDYGLAVDADGNALLAFNDDGAPAERIVAAKVDPSGAPLWGTPGIAVSTFTGFLASPRIAATDDGAVVVGWTQGDAALDVVVQRLDVAGAKLWGTDGITLPHGGDNFLLADLEASDAGSVVVSWVRYVTFLGDKHLWAQKLDADGDPLWGATPVHVYDAAGGSLQFGNFPPFASDGAGGALFAWYTSSPSLQTRAQRILANGSEAFVHDGVELSTDASHLRTDPAACLDPLSGEVTAFWVETNGLQSQFGLSGQRLDGSGNRLWGAAGLTLVALDPRQVSQVRTLCVPPEPTLGPATSDALVVWATAEAFDHQPIRAARLDASGGFVWSPAVRIVKSEVSATSRLAAAWSEDGYAALVWSDGANAADIEAQNLRPDGSLGNPIFTSGFEAGDTGGWSATTP